MNKSKMIAALNKTVALEHAATLQYQQHALLVRGLWRKVFSGYFAEQSKASLSHAFSFSQKVVSLGGGPTIEIGSSVHQSTDLKEMLQQDLALERLAMKAYQGAHGLAEGNIALKTMLENQIEEEQGDIEELELYLEMVETKNVEQEVTLSRVK